MQAFRRYFLFSTRILAVALLLLVGGCSSGPEKGEAVGKIKTKSLTFRCDEQINQGLLLPVDIIYVTRYHMLREITAVGPDRWFDATERTSWEEKQTLSLKGGETKEIKLNKLWRDNAKVLIIYANFKGIDDPHPQQVVIDRTAKKEEKILVLPGALVLER